MLITPLFAAILGFIFVYLSFGVIKIRFTERVSLGHLDNKKLEKAVRIQANFAEYVPLSLLLMWFVETVTVSDFLVSIAGCMLVVARIFHVIGMRNPRQWMILRQLGVLMTFAVIIGLSSVLLYWYFPLAV